MSKIWLYPKQYNQMYKNSYIRIVERAYTEDVRLELDCYLAQIEKLEEQKKILIKHIKLALVSCASNKTKVLKKSLKEIGGL